MTAWTDHVKTYCAKKGISYKQGLKDPECKTSYHNAKTEKKEVDKGNKKFKEHQANKDLLIVGTPSISVPDKMLLITDKGEEKVIHPLTKKGTLARKNNQNIIKMNVSEHNNFKVNSSGITKKEQERRLKVARYDKYNKYYSDNTRIVPDINVLERVIDKETKRIETLKKAPHKTLQQLEEYKKELKELKAKHGKNEDKRYMYGEEGYKDYVHEFGKTYKD